MSTKRKEVEQKGVQSSDDEGIRDEPVSIPAINADEDFASFVHAEMDEAHAEISRLSGVKIARELHYTQAIDRIIEARDAEFAAIDEQVARQTRKHDGCSAALQKMGVEPASGDKHVNVVPLNAERDVA